MFRFGWFLLMAGVVLAIHPQWVGAQAPAKPVTKPGANLLPEGDIRELKLRDWEPRSMMATNSSRL